MEELVKVSTRSNPHAVAVALTDAIGADGAVELQVVGAGALNQAVKAVAIARGRLSPVGVDITLRPTFTTVEIDGEPRTAIRLLVERGSDGSRAPSSADPGPAVTS